MSKQYHYIITGAGCAGSSLLMRMMQDPFFSDKQILVVDQSPKTVNDRTWCFWEKKPGLFESIVHHIWPKLDFFSGRYSATLEITPYLYKMIRGADLYSFVKATAANHPNVEWRQERVLSVDSDAGSATVNLETGSVTAAYVFNSILFEPPLLPTGKFFLWQHFGGWLIKTAQPCFDPGRATLMDFRVSQDKGTTFMYLMPTSDTTALVEYTLFTEQPLEKQAYETALREYIITVLGVKTYEICHEEFGMIPMTNVSCPQHTGRVVHMGIAGGQVKASSGYAFQFIQKRSRQIVERLVANRAPYAQQVFADKKSRLYDSVLLHVLCNGRMKGDEIFARIFQENTPERVLRFLDNESSVWDDLQIMRSVPAAVFVPAAMQELKKML